MILKLPIQVPHGDGKDGNGYKGKYAQHLFEKHGVASYTAAAAGSSVSVPSRLHVVVALTRIVSFMAWYP
jgi:hypothetical protein